MTLSFQLFTPNGPELAVAVELLLLKVSCVSVWRSVWLLFSVVSRLLSLMARTSMVMSVSSRNPKMRYHAYASCSSFSLPPHSFPPHPKYKDVPIPSNPSQRHSPLRMDDTRTLLHIKFKAFHRSCLVEIFLLKTLPTFSNVRCCFTTFLKHLFTLLDAVIKYFFTI